MKRDNVLSNIFLLFTLREAQRCDQLQAQNLDLTVFLIEHTIISLIHGAMNEHPEFLKTRELQEEIVAMLSAYLVQK